jgi:hypothetical protein
MSGSVRIGNGSAPGKRAFGDALSAESTVRATRSLGPQTALAVACRLVQRGGRRDRLELIYVCGVSGLTVKPKMQAGLDRP